MSQTQTRRRLTHVIEKMICDLTTREISQEIQESGEQSELDLFSSEY